MSYKSIFFDLDHTLWDYDRSAEQTLEELYLRYELDKYGAIDLPSFVSNFFQINLKLWDGYNKGDISKYYLRTNRFRLVFEAAQINLSHCPPDVVAGFNSDYLQECPQKGNLLPGAIDTLESLKEDYQIHIITNGFEESQRIKLKYAGLEPYIQEMITSESAKSKKPQEQIFKYALKRTGASLVSSIMIGDNLNTDIKGAREFGMDQVYFNPNGIFHSEKITFEVKTLLEIPQLL